MTDRFNRLIGIILKNEGGFQKNPNDIGNYVNGELRGTKYGIAAKYFPELDIPNLTIEQAKEIYYDKYWLPMKLEGIMDDNIALQMFDFGINAGVRRAIKTAQRIAGTDPDGIMGVKTINAINTTLHFLDKYRYAREEYYRRLVDKNAKFRIFLQGWLNRVEHTKI